MKQRYTHINWGGVYELDIQEDYFEVTVIEWGDAIIPGYDQRSAGWEIVQTMGIEWLNRFTPIGEIEVTQEVKEALERTLKLG